MDQYTLSRLFSRFDNALAKLNRRIAAVKLKANEFQLDRIHSNGVCVFRHKTLGIQFQFNSRTNEIEI